MRRAHTFPPALPPPDPDELLEDAEAERVLAELAEEARIAADSDREETE